MLTPPAPWKRPLSVLVVVVTLSGECLVLNRLRPPQFWQSITGSLRPGETPRHAAQRELYEETGLLAASSLVDLRQSRLFPIVAAWRQRYHAQHHFNREYWFVVWLPQRRLIRLNPKEHQAYRWLALSQAETVLSSWTNREALRLIASRTVC
jgi:dATP pyrophosphohydrolase